MKSELWENKHENRNMKREIDDIDKINWEKRKVKLNSIRKKRGRE